MRSFDSRKGMPPRVPSPVPIPSALELPPVRDSPSNGHSFGSLLVETEDRATNAHGHLPAYSAGIGLIQRQPAGKQPAGQSQQQPASQSLGSLGISARDPLSQSMPPLIDDVFQRDPKVGPYIHTMGRKIGAKGKVVVHSRDQDFENAYDKYAPGAEAYPRGFYGSSGFLVNGDPCGLAASPALQRLGSHVEHPAER